MSDELIPCPFCGSTDIETFYNRSGVDHYTCQYCGATAKDWNTRHESGELPEWVKEAIEDLKDTYCSDTEASKHAKFALDCALSLRKPEGKE